MPITTTYDGAVAVARMEMPRGNAIGLAFLDAIAAALDEVEASPARALVLTGHGKVFSTGLDLVEAYDFDRAALTTFVDRFDELFLRVFAFPKPLVAAVNGHAVAGGCILATAADWRVMAPGPFVTGVTEATLGIPFPIAAFEVVRWALPVATWNETFMEGRRWSPDDALKMGMVNALAGEAGVVADATERARALAAIEPDAARSIKLELKRDTLAAIASRKVETRARFVDAWFGPVAREKIGRVRDELLARKKG